ncbi:hypothetical protein Vadar_001435 [Vaccinium darrowii]|uniref:Uncharacterized protein n=1 Tax=Vaccinium darrowii TaxID=229202 RepID=A0ACB7YC81_9ERIC|nr:hypothetical protein Vadar_001435 [Vaccinium darrowii]
MASPTSEKRCLYEVLGLRLDCTQDEIRSAYKKLALQRHPDKLVQSGLSLADATASFQELVNAYEVLSDPRERSWYDSHRSQILFSNSNPSNSSSSVVPDLFSFFSNSVFSGFTDSTKGFYNVYGGIFGKIYSNELNFAKKLGLGVDAVKEAPVMGNLESPYAQVTAFYGYWLGFVTVMDFCWVDQYDAMAGVNRKSRRVMEEENKKLRKKARREYNETVRGLAEFVKKRDKRVIDMGVRKSEEMERKREEERERKREAEREKMERARAYREPEWAKVEEEDGEVVDDFDDNEEDEKRKKELYCVACGKKFKSEKQWKNHEQSKKHKEKVAELREAFGDEERGEEEEEEGKQEGIVDDGIDELNDHFGGSLQVSKQNSDHVEAQSSEEEERNDVVDDNGSSKGLGESFGENDVDDEASVLEAMLSGHKNKSRNSVHKFKARDLSTNDGGGSDDDETDFREYNNTKGARRKRGARRERGRRYDEEATAADRAETSDQFAENDGRDEGSEKDGTSFPTNVENESNGKGDEKGHKVSKQPVDKKDNAKKEAKLKKDANANSKNASKGRKQKATTKASGTVCDTCGEDFESRNRLHKHLGDTGHASLKSR